MGMRWKINRYAVWIALLAVLLASLAPAISHVVAAAKVRTIALHEVHAMNAHHDMQHVSDEQSQDLEQSHSKLHPAQDHGVPHDGALHMEHCPFCLTGAASFALLPATFSLPILLGGHLLPSLFYASSRPLFAWISSQARAPPLIS